MTTTPSPATMKAAAMAAAAGGPPTGGISDMGMPSSNAGSCYGEKKFFKTEVGLLAGKDDVDAGQWRGWLPQLPSAAGIVPQPPAGRQFGQFKWTKRGISRIARDANRRAPRDPGQHTPPSTANTMIAMKDAAGHHGEGDHGSAAQVLLQDTVRIHGRVEEMGRISRELLAKADVMFRTNQPVNKLYAAVVEATQAKNVGEHEPRRPQEPKKGGSGRRSRPLPRAALLAHPEDQAGRGRPALESAAKVIRARIAEMRNDPQRLAEFSEQCEEWLATSKQRKAEMFGGDTGCQDHLHANAHPQHLATFSPTSQAAAQQYKVEVNEQHRDGTRQEHKRLLTKEYYAKLKLLRKNQLRRALKEGTLSRRQMVDIQASRRWGPVVMALRFARMCGGTIDDRRERIRHAGRLREKRAVRLVEKWWLKMRGGDPSNDAYAVGQGKHWRVRAREEQHKVAYTRIAQFMKDWVRSRKVIEAVRKLLSRTRLVQRWFRSMLLLRRARYRLWMIQWARYEHAQRQTQDAQHTARNRRRGQLPPAAGTSPNLAAMAAPPHGRSPRTNTITPANAPLSGGTGGAGRLRTPDDVHSRLVGKPVGTLKQREQAIAEEMRAQTKRHLARLAQWQVKYDEYVLRLKEHEAKQKHMTTVSNEMGVVSQADPTPPPTAPPRPRVVYVLPQADLARMIEATTKRVQAEIAARVSQNLEKQDQNCPELAPLPTTESRIVDRPSKAHPTSFETAKATGIEAKIYEDIRMPSPGTGKFIL